MTSDGPDAKRLYAMFIDSLRLVAADYETQVSALPTFVCVPDEIAETFASTALLLDQIEGAGFITAVYVEQARAIDAFFGENSGTKNKDFWTLDAMRHDPGWKSMRQAARVLLVSLGEPARIPDLGWIEYVRGAE